MRDKRYIIDGLGQGGLGSFIYRMPVGPAAEPGKVNAAIDEQIGKHTGGHPAIEAFIRSRCNAFRVPDITHVSKCLTRATNEWNTRGEKGEARQTAMIKEFEQASVFTTSGGAATTSFASEPAPSGDPSLTAGTLTSADYPVAPPSPPPGPTPGEINRQKIVARLAAHRNGSGSSTFFLWVIAAIILARLTA